MQRTASGATGNGLYTASKYMRSAAGIGLSTTIKYLVNSNSN
jgi:Na+(H+)/acetate symporter ActP